jgi:hypothetical protein
MSLSDGFSVAKIKAIKRVSRVLTGIRKEISVLSET